jgi:hypothetical protein
MYWRAQEDLRGQFSEIYRAEPEQRHNLIARLPPARLAWTQAHYEAYLLAGTDVTAKLDEYGRRLENQFWNAMRDEEPSSDLEEAVREAYGDLIDAMRKEIL